MNNCTCKHGDEPEDCPVHGRFYEDECATTVCDEEEFEDATPCWYPSGSEDSNATL